MVTEPGSGISKGVGYVAFAIKEDAQMAFEKISKEGIKLDHRKLRVQWAEHKVIRSSRLSLLLLKCNEAER